MKVIDIIHNFSYSVALTEDGKELILTGWNGERWAEGRPVCRWEAEGIDLSTIEENSPEWDNAVEVVEIV